ncbi:hypothetical protein D9611_013281 [Ephemerocybe angulata]|uniref:Uncharacterized protein n=1 Tax=Ephemerocybe angulata TaxID=980116 RepID=A0A8H5CCX5_9AGAR|nr:hypothetical protein D9611_013281 [Tulosesus angulatus]
MNNGLSLDPYSLGTSLPQPTQTPAALSSLFRSCLLPPFGILDNRPGATFIRHSTKRPSPWLAVVGTVGFSDERERGMCLLWLYFGSRLRYASISVTGRSICASQSLVPAWAPRAGGVFLTDAPQRLVQQGKVAPIPVATGNCDGEGTLFAQTTLNLTFDGEFGYYVKSVWLPKASNEEFAMRLRTRGARLILWKGRRLGLEECIGLPGDWVFQAPRRVFLAAEGRGGSGCGVICQCRVKHDTHLGSFHGSDIYRGFLNDYVVFFANNLNPNTGRGAP